MTKGKKGPPVKSFWHYSAMKEKPGSFHLSLTVTSSGNRKRILESFLASTTLRAGEIEIRAKAPALPPPPAHDQHGAPTWEVPTHWVKTSASSMRLASYEVSDGNGSKLDFSVTSFPGDVGGTLANVNRWLGQIGIDPVEESSLSKYVSPIVLDERDAQLVVAEEKKMLFTRLL